MKLIVITDNRIARPIHMVGSSKGSLLMRLDLISGFVSRTYHHRTVWLSRSSTNQAAGKIARSTVQSRTVAMTRKCLIKIDSVAAMAMMKIHGKAIFSKYNLCNPFGLSDPSRTWKDAQE